MEEQVHRLKLQVAQRDNEINILVSMLKRKEAAGPNRGPALGGPSGAAANMSATSNSSMSLSSSSPLNLGSGVMSGPGVTHGSGASPGPGSMGSGKSPGGVRVGVTGQEAASTSGSGVADLMDTALLADRNKAFELFRKSYRQNEVSWRQMCSVLHRLRVCIGIVT